MIRNWAVALVSVVVATMLVALLVAALLVWALPHDQITLVIDGQRVDVPPLSVGHWLVAAIGITIALAVVVVVVPFAIALGLGLPLLVIGAVLALLLSPLLLLAALIAWLWKRSAARRTIER